MDSAEKSSMRRLPDENPDFISFLTNWRTNNQINHAKNISSGY